MTRQLLGDKLGMVGVSVGKEDGFISNRLRRWPERGNMGLVFPLWCRLDHVSDFAWYATENRHKVET